MKKKRSKLFILLTIILVISIGFAVLSTSLTINGLFTFPSNTWNVYLDNVVVDQNGTTTNVPTINSDKDTLTFTSTLNKPGDYYSFNVDVVNNSTIDAMLGSITIDGITSTYSDYLACVVTYSNGTTPNTNDILYKTARVTFNVKLLYKDITTEQIPESILNPTITVTINYRQANDSAIIVEDINHWNFDYTGTPQNFSVPLTGIYKIELWGAQGGNYNSYLINDNSNTGAYTAGRISLITNDIINFYVGSSGTRQAFNENITIFNGGGTCAFPQQKGYGSTGGSSTDVRIKYSSNWKNFESLKSRIMVAAGASGHGYKNQNQYTFGGAGGGLVGYDAIPTLTWLDDGYGLGATQILEGKWSKENLTGVTSAGFGYGGNSYGNYDGGGAGGSGYFGGAGGVVNSGGGGSSFISGHAGCVAIDESSTEDNIVFKNDTSGVDCSSSSSSTYNALGYNTDQKCSIHYSSMVFTDTIMIDGKGYQWTTSKSGEVVGMPNKNGMGKVTGNTGNGYARITFMG